MWQIDNGTDFSVAGAGVTDKTGRNAWVVAVKAAFRLLPGGRVEPLPAADQPSVEHVPTYNGADGLSSLRYEADLLARKRGTDVVLNGEAWAPRGRAASQVEVGLRVGERIKRLLVYGDRVYERAGLGGLAVAAPQAFHRQRIIYERAYGGHDLGEPEPSRQAFHAANPVGCGLVKAVGAPVPCVEYAEPGGGSRPVPGFGAVASYWAPRIHFAGTYDQAWMTERRPLLPADFDPRYFHFAPEDQQFAAPLRGGEVVELWNLTPDSYYSFVLPKHYFGFTTFHGGEGVEHRAELETVYIEPSDARVTMLWKTQLDCHAYFDDIDFTRVIEKEYIEAT